ncbi:stalk domain-containing protein [Effusibacillus consociatus]|uniref:Stalk domain-containing protein n=1 Tax=Effusibacillus consociatus TaxID=1117041 RepID=A0ABV9Q5X1_9BACL
MKKLTVLSLASMLAITPAASSFASAAQAVSPTAKTGSALDTTSIINELKNQQNQDQYGQQRIDQDVNGEDLDKLDKEQLDAAQEKAIEVVLDKLLEVGKEKKGNLNDEEISAIIEKLTEILMQQGEASSEEVAEDLVEEKIELDVEDGTASEEEVGILVTLKMKKNKDEEAVTAVEKALAANPNYDSLYGLLSEIFQSVGNTEKVKVYVGGKQPNFDVQPLIENGRTMIPVRAVTEALGAQVDWKNETQTVVIKKENVIIELPLGSNSIKLNGQTIAIDVPAQVKDNRTLVPVRFISEFLGHQVGWDPNSNMVIVK